MADTNTTAVIDAEKADDILKEIVEEIISPPVRLDGTSSIDAFEMHMRELVEILDRMTQ